MKAPPLLELAIYVIAITLGCLYGYCHHSHYCYTTCGSESEVSSEQIGFLRKLCTDPNAFFTALSALVGLGGFVFLFSQLQAVRSTNATAATQAQAAKDAVDVQIAAQRGKLALLEIDAFDRFNPKVKFTNIGMTAVVHIDSAFYGRIVDAIPSPDVSPHESVDNNENHCVIKPGEVISNFGKLHGVELTKTHMKPQSGDELAIEKGNKFLWVRGWLLYDDVFGDRYKLNFAAIWNKESGKYSLSGYRAYNQEQYLGSVAEG